MEAAAPARRGARVGVRDGRQRLAGLLLITRIDAALAVTVDYR